MKINEEMLKIQKLYNVTRAYFIGRGDRNHQLAPVCLAPVFVMIDKQEGAVFQS